MRWFMAWLLATASAIGVADEDVFGLESSAQREGAANLVQIRGSWNADLRRR